MWDGPRQVRVFPDAGHSLTRPLTGAVIPSHYIKVFFEGQFKWQERLKVGRLVPDQHPPTPCYAVKLVQPLKLAPVGVHRFHQEGLDPSRDWRRHGSKVGNGSALVL